MERRASCTKKPGGGGTRDWPGDGEAPRLRGTQSKEVEDEGACQVAVLVLREREFSKAIYFIKRLHEGERQDLDVWRLFLVLGLGSV